MEIDVAALEAELDQLSPEDLKKQLLDAKVKQRVATKKYYNPETAKKVRLKRAAQLKAQAERAKAMPATDKRYPNLYEQILAEAAVEADRKLAEDASDEEDAA